MESGKIVKARLWEFGRLTVREFNTSSEEFRALAFCANPLKKKSKRCFGHFGREVIAYQGRSIIDFEEVVSKANNVTNDKP